MFFFNTTHHSLRNILRAKNLSPTPPLTDTAAWRTQAPTGAQKRPRQKQVSGQADMQASRNKRARTRASKPARTHARKQKPSRHARKHPSKYASRARRAEIKQASGKQAPKQRKYVSKQSTHASKDTNKQASIARWGHIDKPALSTAPHQPLAPCPIQLPLNHKKKHETKHKNKNKTNSEHALQRPTGASDQHAHWDRTTHSPSSSGRRRGGSPSYSSRLTQQE